MVSSSRSSTCKPGFPPSTSAAEIRRSTWAFLPCFRLGSLTYALALSSTVYGFVGAGADKETYITPAAYAYYICTSQLLLQEAELIFLVCVVCRDPHTWSPFWLRPLPVDRQGQDHDRRPHPVEIRSPRSVPSLLPLLLSTPYFFLYSSCTTC
jgi:hypothetical protein